MKSQVPWRIKLERGDKKNPHIVEAPPIWVDGATDKKMVIPSATELEKIIQAIPAGKRVNIKDIRADYAKKHHADITCPMTSGIFLRIIAECAEEERANGRKDITPYWRIIADNGQMPPKIQAVWNRYHPGPEI